MPSFNWLEWTLIIGLVLFVLMLFGGFYTVKQQTAVVIERFGRFTRVAPAGLRMKIPVIDRIAKRVDLRVQQFEVSGATKTKDDVFVQLPVVVQFAVQPAKVKEAHYLLTAPNQQMQALVADIVRGATPRMNLDELYLQKDEIARAVESALASKLEEFGFKIYAVSITDIEPDPEVRAAMNRINAAQRLAVAAQAEGEAEKTRKVLAAEAEKIRVILEAEGAAKAAELHGKGIAEQRAAMIDGLGKSVEELKKTVPGMTGPDLMEHAMEIQRLDTQVKAAEGASSKVVFLPNPGGDAATRMRDSVFIANEAHTEGKS